MELYVLELYVLYEYLFKQIYKNKILKTKKHFFLNIKNMWNKLEKIVLFC